MRVQILAWQLPVFFLSSFFYPLAFYCLVSLLALLASRDFLRKRISSIIQRVEQQKKIVLKCT